MTSHLRPKSASRRVPTRWRVLVAFTTLVCGLLGAKYVVLQVSTARGISDIRASNYVAAERAFRVNLVANWIDPWRVHFNIGVAQYGQDNWPGAQHQFAQALRQAPSNRRCSVALNLAWSYEAQGDQLAKIGHLPEAAKLWHAAEAAAKGADCSYASHQSERSDTTTKSGGSSGKGNGSGTNNASKGGPKSKGDTKTKGDPKSDKPKPDNSPAEQQQKTVERNQTQASQAERQLAAGQRANQQTQAPQPSKAQRMTELQAANQKAQHQLQQSSDGDKAGRRGDGDEGNPTW